MTDAVVLLGSGPTRKFIPVGMDIAGVSSGYLFCGRCDLLIAYDKVRHFPRYDGLTPAHVPQGQYVKGWNPMVDGPKGDLDLMITLMRERVEWVPGWADFPNVTPHVCAWDRMPDFDPDAPISMGSTSNSMVMAVQVAHKLGYQAIHFAGCDMLDPNYTRAFEAIRWMWPVAKALGYEWKVTNPASRLSEFLEVSVPNGFIKVERQQAPSPWGVPA